MALAVFNEFKDMDARNELQFSGAKSDEPPIKFTIRAGISSGPIVAGVIGLKKFCWYGYLSCLMACVALATVASVDHRA